MSGLQTDNLTVGYGSPLVKEISLCVRPGRVLTLIGPNGCGKSTILKSVTRQLKIMGGSIFLGGQAMETMKEAEIAKKLAMVMTEHIRPELMTCRDIVATGSYPLYRKAWYFNGGRLAEGTRKPLYLCMLKMWRCRILIKSAMDNDSVLC